MTQISLHLLPSPKTSTGTASPCLLRHFSLTPNFILSIYFTTSFITSCTLLGVVSSFSTPCHVFQTTLPSTFPHFRGFNDSKAPKAASSCSFPLLSFCRSSFVSFRSLSLPRPRPCVTVAGHKLSLKNIIVDWTCDFPSGTAKREFSAVSPDSISASISAIAAHCLM